MKNKIYCFVRIKAEQKPRPICATNHPPTQVEIKATISKAHLWNFFTEGIILRDQIQLFIN